MSVPIKSLLICPSVVDTTDVPDNPQRKMRVFVPSVVEALGKLILRLGSISFMLQELKGVKSRRPGGTVRRCEVLGPRLVDGRFEGAYHWVGGPQNGNGLRFLDVGRLFLSGEEKIKEIGVV